MGTVNGDLVEASKKAHQMGMTYGQYQQFLYLENCKRERQSRIANRMWQNTNVEENLGVIHAMSIKK